MTAELLIEQALDAAAAAWLLRLEGEALVLPPSLADDGPIGRDVVLEAWRRLPTDLAARLALDEQGKALLVREQLLRALAPQGQAGQAEALAALQHGQSTQRTTTGWLQRLVQPAAAGWVPAAHCTAATARDWCADQPYLSAPCAWLRYLLRRTLAAGQPLPAAAELPLAALRHESDLLEKLGLARCGQGALEEGLALLLRMPVAVGGGWPFYVAVDACLRARDPRYGLPLADCAIRFFERRDDLFKSLQFSQKAALLAAERFPGRPELGGPAMAIAHHARAIALGEPPMMLDSLVHALPLVPEGEAADGPLMGPVMAALNSRPPELLVQTAARLLNAPGGGQGVTNHRILAALTDSMVRDKAQMVRVPAIAATEPVLFGALLRRRLEHLPAFHQDAMRLAAHASGFTDISATGAHLAHLLARGDRDEVEAIAAFLTRRFGRPWQRDGEITAIVSTNNVGDTLLHLVGLAAFAQLSGKPVRVLYRAVRQALVEMLQHVPLLTFEAIADNTAVPQQLAVNRLAPGSVSVFYHHAWFWGQEKQRIPGLGGYDGFLWHKILAVMLSGGDYLPAQVVPPLPMLRAPEAHTAAARARFAQLGLKRGRTIFLSPLANTLFVLTSSRFNGFREFWQAAIRVFRQHGFTVAVNVLNNVGAEAGLGSADAVAVELDLREVPGFLAECGYFAGVRSGLCDLIALCEPGAVQSKTLYEKGAEHCIGLALFGMPEVVADFNAAPPEEMARSIFQDWLR